MKVTLTLTMDLAGSCERIAYALYGDDHVHLGTSSWAGLNVTFRSPAENLQYLLEAAREEAALTDSQGQERF